MSRAIADIQADLDAYYAARRALATGAQSYSLNTGQTTQTVTKANLSDINKTIRLLNQELEDANFQSSGSDTATFHREY